VLIPQKPEDEDKERQSFSSMFGESAPFLGAGIQLGIGVILMALLGWWLDDKWGTTPWVLLAGVFFGAGAGMYQFIRSVNKISKREEEKKEQLRH
jgi:F0F1-type ATP synthase assembly protein I